ncbi:MAG: endo alpha-1,4 polygalactosaminidase [Bacilli bacterium]|nr:endo alpha-1,4 polygalactosaminidase [Bacilli bacterium]
MRKLILFLLPLMLASCSMNKIEPINDIKYQYGVFLSCEPNDMKYMTGYKTIVIDAQYFEKGDVLALKEHGNKVFSYINLGSIENFRSYYDMFKDITLGEYENWEEERWVDVSNVSWQNFIINDLSSELLFKGVDGLFVDNCDVYYNYQTDAIFDGVTTILKGLKNKGTYVSINGGDTYVSKYIEKNNKISDVMNAVNQETVFSKINWNTKTFSRNDNKEKEYFQQYVETVSSYGGDVYLLEYTKDNSLIKEINEYCKSKNFIYYAADDLELKIPTSYKGSQKI